MASGRTGKPTGPPKTQSRKQKELLGNPKAHLTKEEPGVDPNKPIPPKTLSPEERKVWDETVEDLTLRGLCSASHAKSIAIFCRLWVEYEKLSVMINERGVTETKLYFNKKTGEVSGEEEVPSELAKRRQEVANQLYKYGWNMGWTPLSNLQLTPLKPAQGANKKQRFFK